MRGFSAFAAVCALVSALAGASRAQEFAPVDQGWSGEDKRAWYTVSQGSRLIPLAWLQALEQPGSSAPFLDRAHIEKLRYLPAAEAGRLPIGFAIDTQDDRNFTTTRLRWKKAQGNREPWVGFTCAACHTAEMTFAGRRLRIDGAPALADFQGFLAAFNRALAETRDDPAKFDRFAAAVLKGADTTPNRAMLKAELGKLTAWESKVAAVNHTSLEWGFGRVDAFTQIFNRIMLRLETGAPGNPPDAPVSYPFLWNIHQQDKVQWNGIAPNVPVSPKFDVGAMGRNVGEALGVFADFRLRPVGPAIDGYPSSVHVPNLNRLEQLVARLKPPVWPDALPPIDAAKWEAGKALFEQGCASCHKVLPRDDLTTRVKVEMTPLIGARRIGTDPWMACNAYTYQTRSGLLALTPKQFFVLSSLPLTETEPLAVMAETVVFGTLWNKRADLAKLFKTANIKGILQAAKFFESRRGPTVFDSTAFLAELFPQLQSGERAARLKRCFEEAADILAYKGRPLTGIWATPPYLHNGSVPTLYDLLLPPQDRPASFALGTRAFDPEKVGYVTEGSKFATDQTRADSTFVFRTRDANGPISGNGNDGHDYGTALDDKDRWALVEYMKAVGGRRMGDRVVP